MEGWRDGGMEGGMEGWRDGGMEGGEGSTNTYKSVATTALRVVARGPRISVVLLVLVLLLIRIRLLLLVPSLELLVSWLRVGMGI